MIKNHLRLCTILMLFFANLLFAQQRNFWARTSETARNKAEVRKSAPDKQKVFTLELGAFKDDLKRAPRREDFKGRSNFKVIFPDGNGYMETYLVKEASVMHPDLARKYPQNRSYVGVSEKDGTKRIRFSVNKLGLNAMIRDVKGGIQYIEPLTRDKRTYSVFFRSDLQVERDFECLTGYSPEALKSGLVKIADDGLLRTYRLALAATGEYSQYHIQDQNAGGGSDQEKKAVVLSAMTTAMTMVNAIYENDVAITMQLVANNDDIIYLDPNNDPYTNLDESIMLGENQTACDNVIGSDNYDIGHVFGTGGGGVSTLSIVCRNGVKARGVTGLPNPIGDYFYYDYVAHEMGHQFGANHSFNGDDDLCGGDNRNDPTAVETGSGSSLMSYAGLCGTQNVQGSVDPYFHIISIEEIRAYVTAGAGSGCPVETALVLNQNVPVADAGADFTIPKGTPFKLTGTGSDADNDPISFSWEQTDNEITAVPPSGNSVSGALYRSYPPAMSPVRYMPELTTLITGEISSTWEVTPDVSRDMNFAFTVRDNNTEAGQVASDNLQVTVTDAAGPFVVTSQNTDDLVWTPGTEENITWNVAGTDGNGVNVSQVNILLSTDWGKTFSTVLASNVPNDGSQTITVPDLNTPQCFLIVEAVGNHFFAMNAKGFSIGQFNQLCNIHESVDTPLSIPDDDSEGVTSTINVPDDISVENLKVRLINTSNPSANSPGIIHTYLGDLTITLESPMGTVVELLGKVCGASEDIEAILDDSGDPLSCNVFSPGISGIKKPGEALSIFNGENAQGNWILKVIDNAADDEGSIESWSLEICSSEPVLGVNNYVFDDFRVFPNPSDGAFRIKFRSEDAGDVEVNVYDLLGRKIAEKTYRQLSNDFEEEMDLQQVSGGIYILRVKRGNKISSHKIRIK